MSQAETIMSNPKLLSELVQLTSNAGDVILKIYHSDNFNVQNKLD